MRLRLYESAIAPGFGFSQKIRRSATFDFCNTIGTKRTYRGKRSLVRFWGEADMARPPLTYRSVADAESPGGISPPGAPRTVHDPLESHGSRCSAVAMT